MWKHKETIAKRQIFRRTLPSHPEANTSTSAAETHRHSTSASCVVKPWSRVPVCPSHTFHAMKCLSAMRPKLLVNVINWYFEYGCNEMCPGLVVQSVLLVRSVARTVRLSKYHLYAATGVPADHRPVGEGF